MTIRAGTSRNSFLTLPWYEVISMSRALVPVTFSNEEKNNQNLHSVALRLNGFDAPRLLFPAFRWYEVITSSAAVVHVPFLERRKNGTQKHRRLRKIIDRSVFFQININIFARSGRFP